MNREEVLDHIDEAFAVLKSKSLDLITSCRDKKEVEYRYTQANTDFQQALAAYRDAVYQQLDKMHDG